MTAAMDRAAIRALLDTDLAAGIYAAADLREQRATAVPRVSWQIEDTGDEIGITSADRSLQMTVYVSDRCCYDYIRTGTAAEHIAAEANPAHALAAVHHWRGVTDRHTPIVIEFSVHRGLRACRGCSAVWPCADLRETNDDVRAYLGEPA